MTYFRNGSSICSRQDHPGHCCFLVGLCLNTVARAFVTAEARTPFNRAQICDNTALDITSFIVELHLPLNPLKCSSPKGAIKQEYTSYVGLMYLKVIKHMVNLQVCVRASGVHTHSFAGDSPWTPRLSPVFIRPLGPNYAHSL